MFVTTVFNSFKVTQMGPFSALYIGPTVFIIARIVWITTLLNERDELFR